MGKMSQALEPHDDMPRLVLVIVCFNLSHIVLLHSEFWDEKLFREVKFECHLDLELLELRRDRDSTCVFFHPLPLSWRIWREVPDRDVYLES